MNGTSITIHDNVVLASEKSITAHEVKAGSVSVDTVQKKTVGGELNINSGVVVPGSLLVGGAVNGVANSFKSNNIETPHIKSIHKPSLGRFGLRSTCK